ncbi:NAD(P)-binding protein [Setomelanomma holmii]|uniref:NAD(P)-binding protein n=1 Tax=Setomelanomma holmii TaxID=210430 RepID=A0A9P4HD22_9PLEO|nr:NAD(P)-binding protein [Setomelanomma holmii]
MGLAVATSLSQRADWTIHILDLNPSGPSIASSLNATSHACNVTDESLLASIFKTIFTSHHRIDFVFANASIAERANFYLPKSNTSGTDDPVLPVKGMHALIDINLKSVIMTTYLAAHYMRLFPSAADKSICITASCGGLYPSYYSPIYTATKHAVVGFMRSIAPWYYHKSGIRVNAICPGVVKTNLLSSAAWKNFPESYLTPVEKIAKTVGMLVGVRDDGTGVVVEGRGCEDGSVGEVLYGKAVEISGTKHYSREAVEFADEAMKAVMGATNIEVLDNALPT